jgi:hypothetical protein
MSYFEFRECHLKWDKAQQCWSHFLPVSSDEVPMEMGRIEQKGKGKKGGKDAKGKGKGPKGVGKNGKNKSKGKDGFTNLQLSEGQNQERQYRKRQGILDQ